MPILGYCSAPSCSSIMVSVRAMKLGSNAHNERIYGCARETFQWRWDFIATDNATHFFFTLQKLQGKICISHQFYLRYPLKKFVSALYGAMHDAGRRGACKMMGGMQQSTFLGALWMKSWGRVKLSNLLRGLKNKQTTIIMAVLRLIKTN